MMRNEHLKNCGIRKTSMVLKRWVFLVLLNLKVLGFSKNIPFNIVEILEHYIKVFFVAGLSLPSLPNNMIRIMSHLLLEGNTILHILR